MGKIAVLKGDGGAKQRKQGNSRSFGQKNVAVGDCAPRRRKGGKTSSKVTRTKISRKVSSQEGGKGERRLLKRHTINIPKKKNDQYIFRKLQDQTKVIMTGRPGR